MQYVPNVHLTILLLLRTDSLWLYRNYLDGKIPTELGNLVKGGQLELMVVYDNHFFGTVPDKLCPLETLQFGCLADVEHRNLCGCDCSCDADGTSEANTTATFIVGPNETLQELTRPPSNNGTAVAVNETQKEAPQVDAVPSDNLFDNTTTPTQYYEDGSIVNDGGRRVLKNGPLRQ